jgi:catechol 2,3-dioxygenase-like lactoylglutathione lyase family enzyme
VTVRSVRPILNVSDVRESLAWFEQLGWKTAFVWDDDERGEPGFGGISFGEEAEIFLCRNGQGERGTWVSWFVDELAEVDEMHARALELGLDVVRAPVDEPWGVREFHLRHPDGHMFRVGAFSGG